MASQQQWGVTPPISMSAPTEKELELNDALLAELKQQDNFESPEDTEKRKIVLEKMQQVTERWWQGVNLWKLSTRCLRSRWAWNSLRLDSILMGSQTNVDDDRL